MHWAKKEVPSVELCKRLKELGFPQKEPGWFWCLRKDSEFYDLFFTMDKMYFYKPKQYEEFFIFEYYHLQDYIKAYTSSELGEWLPIVIEDYGLSIYKTLNGWAIEYEKLNFVEGSKKTLVKIKCDNETEANVRAKMIIFLRENEYITFNQGDNNAQSR